MVTNIQLSQDGSALVVNDKESQALCHFCGHSEPFAVPQDSLTNIAKHSKPKKWALIRGGSLKSPKRFFICVGCIRLMVNRRA